jgi:hypothetical protein
MDGEQPEAPRRNGDAGATPAGPREPTAGGSGRLPEPTRRGFLAAAGLGAGTLAVIGAGGLTWRAVSQGVFATGTGPAYAAWDQWTPPGHAPLNLIRAAVLAASAHNTQRWLFAITPARIDLFAVPSRNIGTVDPLRREMQISPGHAWRGGAVLREPGVIDHVRRRGDHVGRPSGHVAAYRLVAPRRRGDELLQRLVIYPQPSRHRLHRLARPVGQQPPRVQLALGPLIPPGQHIQHLSGELHQPGSYPRQLIKGHTRISAPSTVENTERHTIDLTKYY